MTFISKDPLTNGELHKLYDNANPESDEQGFCPATTCEERLNHIRARLEDVLPELPSPDLKARYSSLINEVSRMHARSSLRTLMTECRSRGGKITPQLRRTVASIAVVGLRMGMIAAAKLREQGIDPLEALYVHGVAQAHADPEAAELRAFLLYTEQFGTLFQEFFSGAWSPSETGDSA